jgi:hypothetical protein
MPLKSESAIRSLTQVLTVQIRHSLSQTVTGRVAVPLYPWDHGIAPGDTAAMPLAHCWGTIDAFLGSLGGSAQVRALARCSP